MKTRNAPLSNNILALKGIASGAWLLNVQVRELAAETVMTLRHAGPFNEVGAKWARLMGGPE